MSGGRRRWKLPRVRTPALTRRAPRLLYFLSGAFFIAALTVFVGNPGLSWPVAAALGVAILMFLVALYLEQPEARRRFRSLRTFAERIKPLVRQRPRA